MPLITGLDHVLITAPPACEAAARAFFGTLLGLTEWPKPPALAARGGVWFALPDGRQLHVGVVTAGFVASDKAHPCLRTDDLAALMRALDGAGVAWQEDTENADVRRLFLRDPWGNRLEIAEFQRA